MYTLGIYGPSLLYKYIITNCTYGKKIKKPRKALDYTYYFDKDDKLILIDKENYTVSFYFYDSNVTKILTFSSFKKNQAYLFTMNVYMMNAQELSII